MRDPASPSLLLTRRGLLLAAAGTLAGCEETSGPLPTLTLPPISGLKTNAGWPVPGVDTRLFARRVTVLNVWASWCPYCRGEHGLLHQLASSGPFSLVGLVYRDSEEKARAYLMEAGNPYAAISVDAQSQISGFLGQRGVPHTYVIGRDLKVAAKVRGALSPEAIDAIIKPAVAKAAAGA